MQYELLKFNKNKDDFEARLKAVFSFALENGDVDSLAYPQTLIEGLFGGAIKVFTAKEDDKIKAMNITLVVKDPIQSMKYHLITALDAGDKDEGFKTFVDNVLLAYQ